MDATSRRDRLLQIADELRKVPETFAPLSPSAVAEAAGARFNEALKLGAFPGSGHIRLRMLVDEQRREFPSKFYGIWLEAITCLLGNDPHLLSVGGWTDACGPIADAIEAEARRIGAERIPPETDSEGWSPPRTRSYWIGVFRFSGSTFDRRVKDGQIVAKKLGKMFQLRLDCVPGKPDARTLSSSK